MRTHLIVGNWKMHKTAEATVAFIDDFLQSLHATSTEIDIALAPPFTALGAAADRLREHMRVGLAAQDMHWEEQGAFTGAIAPGMLVEFGVSHVIVGHSERRRSFGETDEMVNKKVKAALAHDLTPIVCVGEPLSVRDGGGAQAHIVTQTHAAFAGVPAHRIAHCVIAYEPIWAIGTGKNCDVNEANAAMASIREGVPGASHATMLYGGSVTPQNMREYARQPHVDGALVGGASLDPVSFFDLIRAAHEGFSGQ